MSTKNKKPSPKLDGTVKYTGSGFKIADTLPPFKKPWAEFRRTVRVGDIVTVEKRFLNDKKMQYELYPPLEGIVMTIETNQIIIADDDDIRHGMPWWSIHNWEILEGGDEDDRPVGTIPLPDVVGEKGSPNNEPEHRWPEGEET